MSQPDSKEAKPGENDESIPVIMIVDDQADMRKLIELNLKKIGYTRLVMAENGREALDKASKHAPDLILLDIDMPVMDGITACTEFKKDPRFSDIPIIIVSALGDIKSKAAAYGSGADDYLAKPLDTITLAARCRAVLQTKQLQAKMQRMADSRAISDSLFNYKFMYERLIAYMEYCRRKGLPFSLIYADIDYMKLLNTTYNAFTGDKVIHQVREIFYRRVEKFGAIITSNSDKLIVMLPGLNEGRAQVLSDDILDEIRKISLPVEFEKKLALDSMAGRPSTVTKVTLSMGIVTWDKVEGVPAEKLLDLAEKALRAAKDEGRNKKVQYQFYSQPDADGVHKIDKMVVKDYRRTDED